MKIFFIQKLSIFIFILIAYPVFNISYSATFEESHKLFCKKYVGKNLIISGKNTKITNDLCDNIYLSQAPFFQKEFGNLLSSFGNSFQQYQIKKYQIEDFSNKSIDYNQFNCGEGKLYKFLV